MAGVLVVVYRDALIPERFSYDATRISGIARGTGQAYGDRSYENVGDVYGFLGLGDHPVAAGLLGFLVYLATLMVVRRECKDREPSLGTLIVVPLAVILGAVYIGTYSKDALVAVVALGVMIVPRNKVGEGALLAVMIGYALLFREYWLLVAAVFIVHRILFARPRSSGLIAVVLVGELIVLSLAFFIVLGVDPDHFRTMVNDVRLDDIDAQSAIHPFVSGAQPMSGMVNVLLTFVALFLPWPLLLTGGLYYLALTVLLLFIWVPFFRVVFGGRAHPTIVRRAISLVLALCIVQALFEPDYGSALRHMTALLPLVILVVWQGSELAAQRSHAGQRRFGRQGVPG